MQQADSDVQGVRPASDVAGVDAAAVPDLLGAEAGVGAPLTPVRPRWRALTENPTGVVAGIIIGLIALIVIFVPMLPGSPIAMNLASVLQPPGAHHLMGTDQFGREIFGRVAAGGRVTLTMGVVAVLIAAGVGLPLGLLAGFYEGLLDSSVMRLMDMMLAFPGLLLALAVVATLGQGIFKVMIAVGISLIPSYVRLMRGAVLANKHNVYVEAAQALGASNLRILLRHIVPNSMAPIIVLATVSIGWAIVIAASLNFLGMGVQYPNPEWGSDLNSGRQYLSQAWWISTFPGAAIMVTILCFNLIGDALREVLDPRLQVTR
ncbi:ABC transporter permease [Candidatus Nephthysia bennettiae]|uniref:ABC transporter permease n=1 Tax=Candidatus Nephthysia bennettiae TaxID=3127016 RepID=UPI0030C78235